jgi:DNA-binding FadR family transcriptional regulator
LGQSETRLHHVIAGASGSPYLQTVVVRYRAMLDAMVTQDAQTASQHMADYIAYISQVVQATFLTSPQVPRPERRETRKKDA